MLKEGVRREVYTEWKRGKKLSRIAGVLVKAAIECGRVCVSIRYVLKLAFDEVRLHFSG